VHDLLGADELDGVLGGGELGHDDSSLVFRLVNGSVFSTGSTNWYFG